MLVYFGIGLFLAIFDFILFRIFKEKFMYSNVLICLFLWPVILISMVIFIFKRDKFD